MFQDYVSSIQIGLGVWAGNGGFLIDAKNNTTLIGSVIASSDKAVADGINNPTTGTLVTEDLKNTARYSGSHVPRVRDFSAHLIKIGTILRNFQG